MDEIVQGFNLSLMGLLVTFTALAVLVLVMVILREAFADRKPAGSESRNPDEKGTLPGGREIERRRALAAAVSVAHLRALRPGSASLGERLQRPPGAWWLAKTPEEPG